MTPAGYHVAVVGAADLVGREIVGALHERAFPVRSLRLFDDASMRGEDVGFGAVSLCIETLEAAIGPAAVVFVTGGAPVGPREIAALAPDAVTIDCSGRCALDDDVPLVVPECNPDAVAGGVASRLVASPDPVAVALSVVLAPLHQYGGVRRAVVTALDPVSEAGILGIEELSRETLELLNGRSVEPEVFASRIAFNVLPRVGAVGESGDTAAESRAAAQVRKVLDDAAVEISVSRVYVPAFYGAGMTLNVELGRALEPGAVQAVLRHAPGILVVDADGGLPAAIADAVEQDATLVSRIRADGSVENGVNLWVAIDNVRKGRAVNAVQIAELVVRHFV